MSTTFRKQGRSKRRRHWCQLLPSTYTHIRIYTHMYTPHSWLTFPVAVRLKYLSFGFGIFFSNTYPVQWHPQSLKRLIPSSHHCQYNLHALIPQVGAGENTCQKHLLLLQRTWLQFPGPTSRGSQLPVTAAQGIWCPLLASKSPYTQVIYIFTSK